MSKIVRSRQRTKKRQRCRACGYACGAAVHSRCPRCRTKLASRFGTRIVKGPVVKSKIGEKAIADAVAEVIRNRTVQAAGLEG